MSLKTWMQEFYPVRADCCRRPRAVAHSLQRWKGFRAANIKKHNLRMNAIELYHVTNCALCHTRQCVAADDPEYEAGGPPTCPIYTQDDSVCTPGVDALYDDLDPEPMIAALEKALKKEKAKRRRTAKRKGKK